MNQATISNMFSGEFKGQKNFMTPHVIRYGKQNGLVYELSSGTAFLSGGTIYGVTVLECCTYTLSVPKRRRTDLSKCFHSLREAEEYIETLE